MPLMSWNANYSVGLKEVDTQHQRLVSLINDLHSAMLEGRSNEALSTVLCSLVDYTKKHFAYEETLFSQYVYPEMTKHKALHADLTAKATDLQQRVAAGSAGISIEVMNFLKGWLTTHIMGADKDYGPFLKSKGLN